MVAGLLVGRDGERRLLGGLIGGLTAGNGGGLVVRGDAGVGKSALLAEAARLASAQGFRVLRATGVDSAAHLAFAGLEELLRPIRDRIEQLAPPQRAAVSSALGLTDTVVPDAFLIALGTLNLIAEAASGAPILVLVEDAHWLDVATADVIAFVARRLEFEPIALIAAVRGGYPSPIGGAALPALELAPLTGDASAALLDANFPGLPATARTRVLREAAGNPLALVELPIGLDGEVAATAGWLPLSERLEQTFGARISRLPTETLRLLVIAAVDDGCAISEVLAAARGLEVEHFVPAVAAGLIHLVDGRVAFRHPLVRSAVLQRATAAERYHAHTVLAQVLDAEIERRAYHRGASVAGPDDGIAAELDAAGARAHRRGAVQAAVTALERAAQLSSGPGDRADRLVRAAALAAEVGRHDSVVRLLNQAESLELSASQRALAAATRDAFDDGLREVAGSARMLAEVAERQAADGDVDLALKVLWSASLRCYFGEPGPEVRARVVAAAERVAPGPADPRVLAVFGFVAPIERGRVIHDCLPDAVRQVDGDPTAARMLGNAALGLGAFDVALSLLTTAAVGLRPQGRLALLTRATSAAVWCALNLMNLGAAIAIAEESTRLARETGQRTLIPLCRAHECMIYAMRGEHDTMERIASEVEREALPIGIRPALAVIQLARGLSALGSGRYSDAFDHLRRVFDPADPAYHIGFRCFYVGDLVEAALRSGRADEVAGVVAEMEAAGRRTPSPSLHLNLRYARALLAGPADAEELFRAALSTDLSRWPFARARAQLAYGEWLRRRRRPAEARPHLRAAREAFDALGVIAWGDRARAELRSSGEGSRGRIVSAHEVLTPQELQIAQMAADGLTNREIGQKLYLSHRTISTHLHRIFPKLGITSRAALAAALTVT